ncbi:MAG: hypothetical protein H6695_04675 [Deferribacteres bacterium]|nr:hypothetical protein [candidate division KSB1 bacterium]MCB9509449.1 hypothetical protein [Deferribacteres bacterium]
MYKIIITSSSVLAIGLYFGLQNQILALPKDQITISHEQIDDNAVEHPQPENAPEAVEPEPSEAKPDIFIKEPILEAKVELANEAEPVADLVNANSQQLDILSLLKEESKASDETSLVGDLLEVDLTSIVKEDLRAGLIKVGKSKIVGQFNTEGSEVTHESIDEVLNGVEMKAESVILRKERVSLRNNE